MRVPTLVLAIILIASAALASAEGPASRAALKRAAAPRPAPAARARRSAADSANAARAAAPAPDSAAVLAMLEGVENVSCPLPGVATGGQIAAAHVESLRKGGFRTVLDLRGEAEARGFPEADAVRKAGLAYVTLPVTPETLDDATFDRARKIFGDATLQPMMVHCRSGNRVGAMMLPWLVLDRGWTLAAATAAAERAGMHASPYQERALDYVARRSAAK